MYYFIIFLVCSNLFAMEKTNSTNTFDKQNMKTALSCALHSSQLKKLKSLIPQASDYLKNSETPWVYDAVPYGLEIVTTFVEHGARVEIINPEDGWSPLMLAASINQPNIVEYLLAKDAKINHQSFKKENALKIAADYGLHDLVKFLQRNGAKLPDNSTK